MRIRGTHIVVGIIVLVGAFIVFAALQDSGPSSSHGSASQGEGNLPPAGESPDNVPGIKVEPEELYMGTVPNDKNTTKYVQVTNTGKTPLEIKDVTTTCNCTRGTFEQKIIKPGETVPMAVTFYPNIVKGFTSHKLITIQSNAPRNSMLEIHVHTEIDPEFALVPPALDFGEVKQGATPKLTTILRQVGPELIALEDILPPKRGARGVTMDFIRRPEGDWENPDKPEYEITAALSPDLPPGDLSTRFKLKTTCKRIPEMSLDLSASITAPYRVSDSSITLRPRLTEGDKAGTVTIASDQPLTVKNISLSDATLKAEMLKGEEPNSIDIEVSTQKATTEEPAPDSENRHTLTFDVECAGTTYTNRVSVSPLRLK